MRSHWHGLVNSYKHTIRVLAMYLTSIVKNYITMLIACATRDSEGFKVHSALYVPHAN